MNGETLARDPVGYADGSRFHELREGRLNLALWAEESAFADTPLYTRPQPAIPATVTDEDVERACVAFYHDPKEDAVGWHNLLREDAMQTLVNHVRSAMRDALESFANKETTDE